MSIFRPHRIRICKSINKLCEMRAHTRFQDCLLCRLNGVDRCHCIEKPELLSERHNFFTYEEPSGFPVMRSPGHGVPISAHAARPRVHMRFPSIRLDTTGLEDEHVRAQKLRRAAVWLTAPEGRLMAEEGHPRVSNSDFTFFPAVQTGADKTLFFDSLRIWRILS